MNTCVTNLLAQLIAVPSINPELAAPGEINGERALTAWLAKFATGAGWKWALQEVHPGRENFLAFIPGGGNKTILWEAHQDTVSAAQMTVSAFAGEVRNGRMYGRGACDVKGSLAAMLTALQTVGAESHFDRPNILMAATVNEESGFSGAKALARLLSNDSTSAVAEHGGLSNKQIRSLTFSYAIVGEPTDLNVVVSHRGIVRWRCSVHGRAAHSSQPENGANAIYAIAQVVDSVERYHREELAVKPSDPLCGDPSICLTKIHGGSGTNTVPEYAVVDIDLRPGSGTNPDEAYGEVLDFIRRRIVQRDCEVRHDLPWLQSCGLASGPNLECAEKLLSVCRAMGVTSRITGVPYGTNAAAIAATGIPTVVFGPGSIQQAHTNDEYVEIEHLGKAVDVLCGIANGATLK